MLIQSGLFTLCAEMNTFKAGFSAKHMFNILKEEIHCIQNGNITSSIS